jgi:predicted AlkP superfamily pyrophosphatase or phosphodiesterase
MRMIAGLVLALIAVAVQASEPAPPIVVLLSWDGMRHDFPDRGEYPGLARMARAGARAAGLVPVYPSNTFPGHVSLATGTWPDRHGIVDNHFLDRTRGEYRYEADADWLLAEPLWIAAERQGVPTATYFWVGSESDWRGLGTRYRIAPFDADRPERAKVDQILAWLELPDTRRPRLIMSYWRGADSVAHRDGPDAASVGARIAGQDAELVRLLEGIDGLGLWSRTTLLVVSDHGMTVTGGYIDARGALDDAGIEAHVVGATVAHVFLERPADRERARAVLAALPGARLLDEAELTRRRLRIAERNGDLVLAAEPPDSFSWPAGAAGALLRASVAAGHTIGSHGYRPELPEMNGILYALGRRIAPNARPGAMHQVDVAATVAGLLGIAPPRDSEGVPIEGLTTEE